MKGWLWAAVGLALVGVGIREVRAFEDAAARDIRAKLTGDKAKVSVRTRPSGLLGYLLGDLSEVRISASEFGTEGLPLFTEPNRSTRGRARRLVILLEDFQLKRLRIQRLEATIPNCRFDLGLAMRSRKVRLSKSGIGTGTVKILATDLEAFILDKFREIKSVKVAIREGKVFVDGYGEFLIVKTNFTVIAQLEPIDGTKLALVNAKILFDGRAADEPSAKVLLDTLNPVVDLQKDLALYDAIRVDKVVLEDGAITASGAVKIPDAPKGE